MFNEPWIKWALLIGVPVILLILYRVVLRAIGQQHIKIMPDILIGGNGEGSGGPINGLLGLQLLEQLRRKGDDKGQQA